MGLNVAHHQFVRSSACQLSPGLGLPQITASMHIEHSSTHSQMGTVLIYFGNLIMSMEV